MKRNFFFLSLVILFFMPLCVQAEDIPEHWLKTIHFTHEIQDFKLPLHDNQDFFIKQEETYVNGEKIRQKKEKVCYWDELKGEAEKNKEIRLETKKTEWDLDTKKVEEFLLEYVLPKVEKEVQSVRIFRDEEENIQFEGAAAFGKKIDVKKTVALLKSALENDINHIDLPVDILEPDVIVEAEDLRDMGIQEVVSIGESDFTGSTWARMKNIEVGAHRFSGKIIPQGEVFSFNHNLGNVTSQEGYLPELVILGQRVEKEYGGGLCQVSSTTFRAALLGGLPIVERYPHSFAVSYYSPFGTDATIYLGGKDLKFQNDTKGAILMQTAMDRELKKLRFLFYGNKDDRRVRMFGPQISNRKGALAARYENSTSLPPGATKKLSSPVTGLDATWYRVVTKPNEETQTPENSIYSIFSRYQPRGLWIVTGVSGEGG